MAPLRLLEARCVSNYCGVAGRAVSAVRIPKNGSNQATDGIGGQTAGAAAHRQVGKTVAGTQISLYNLLLLSECMEESLFIRGQ